MIEMVAVMGIPVEHQGHMKEGAVDVGEVVVVGAHTMATETVAAGTAVIPAMVRSGAPITKTVGMVPSGGPSLLTIIKKGTPVAGEAFPVRKFKMLLVRKHFQVAGVLLVVLVVVVGVGVTMPVVVEAEVEAVAGVELVVMLAMILRTTPRDGLTVGEAVAVEVAGR